MTSTSRPQPSAAPLRLLALACALWAAPALAGDFIDSRLSFVFADDNVFAAAGESTINSPLPGFGAGNQNTQFFDNFNTRFTGFETLSNLSLYKKSFSFFEGWTAEAALNVLLLERSGGGIELRDNSSYITLAYKPWGWKEGTGVSLTGFPVSADRLRLGYAYKVSWGGSSVFSPGAQADGVPGVKLQFATERFQVWAGMKTALILNDLIKEKERLYGGMGGLGVDILEKLRFDISGGYFQKGLVPGLASNGIRAPVNAAGGSAQLQWHKGPPIGTSIDLRLYRNDPDMFQRFFSPESYPGGFTYVIAVEGALLAQTLEDPDVFAKTNLQYAHAVALQARFKWNFLRWGLLGLYRSLSYIQFDVPGVPPFKDFPDGTELRPEMFLALNVDYHIERWHLTPGITAGFQLPAAFRAPQSSLGGNNPSPNLESGGRWAVVRDVNLLDILPAGYDPLYIFSAKANARLDISEYFAAIAEVYYTMNPNKVTFRDDVAGIAQPTFESPHGLGFNVILQARY